MFGGKKKNEQAPRRRTPQEDVSEPGAIHSQFTRNRTLSSYKHNTPDESSRKKAHTLAKQRRKLGAVFSISIAVVVLLILLLWQLVAQVAVTTSTKQLGAAFDGAKYEKVINEYLALNPAQRLRFALNEADLTAYVAAQLPEVEALTLSGTPGIAKGNFAITFRTPVAGWQINTRQHYVDQHGVVFQQNYYPAPTVLIIDESGITPEQGTAVTGTRLLGFLGKVVAQAGERGYTVTRAVLPANTTREVDLFIEGTETRLKFSVDRGAGEQVEDADRVIKLLSGQNVSPEYIDVRVPGRAAYR